MVKADPAAPVRVIEETPAYWKVVFDYPPFNILDAAIFDGLQNLLVRMDTSQSLRVVVFESAIPDFYLAHFDLTGKTGNITTAVGPSGLPILMDTFVRITKSPVVSIAKIRGCVRGGSSEFVLACDMHFASLENTRLGQPEVGVGVHPAAAALNACLIWSAAAAPSKSFSARTTSMATRRNGTDTSTAASRLRARRLCRCARAPDRLLRSACHHSREESRQPGLAAVGRPAPRRHHLL
jgi:enoyl-CoA hydratase/carnithine racemase